MEIYSGRLAVQQRVLPFYRAPFFDCLASLCSGGLSVYAGQPRANEAIETIDRLENAVLYSGTNQHLFKGPFYLCRQTGLLDWLKEWQPSALIVEANPRYLSTQAAVDWMHAQGHPVIGWGLGAPPPAGILAGLRSTRRKDFLSHFDGLISYSQRGADEYREMGFPAEKIWVARNAAAQRPTRPAPIRPAQFSGAPVVLFVGRLQDRKRVDTLLEACAGLPKTIQPQLWIVGDGPARADFETCARNVYPSARFWGAQRGPDLDALFDAADLFVLPGTGGLAVQQAMSHALPVVVGEADGSQVDLVRPENGWQVQAGERQNLMDALKEALADAGKLREKGLASYRIVSEEINLEAMAGVFIQALREISKK